VCVCVCVCLCVCVCGSINFTAMPEQFCKTLDLYLYVRGLQPPHLSVGCSVFLKLVVRVQSAHNHSKRCLFIYLFMGDFRPHERCEGHGPPSWSDVVLPRTRRPQGPEKKETVLGATSSSLGAPGAMF